MLQPASEGAVEQRLEGRLGDALRVLALGSKRLQFRHSIGKQTLRCERRKEYFESPQFLGVYVGLADGAACSFKKPTFHVT